MAEELFNALGEDYKFIETEPMEEERVKMGWNARNNQIPYLMQYYKTPDEAAKLILESDVVVFGGCDDESYIAERLRQKKPVIRVSERLYKSGQWKAISPKGLIKKYKDHTSHNKDDVILLCAGAYVPSDFHIVKAYPDKMYRWGYFPPFVEQDIDKLIAGKKENETVSILWAGRFIDWKHPENAIDVAKYLKDNDTDFKMTIIGDGDCKEALMNRVKEDGLSGKVVFAGFKSPDVVREYMENHDLFLFTSDYLEGWGAVLNEAMNSACAVVANSATGATPYLINHGENGFAYQNGHVNELCEFTLELVKDSKLREEFGRNAYKTIADTWNAKNAAGQIIRLCNMLTGKEHENEPLLGPGSKAQIISVNKMHQRILNHTV